MLAVIAYGITFFLNIFFMIPQLSMAPISTIILMIYSFILCTAVVYSGSLYFDGGKYSSPKQFVRNFKKNVIIFNFRMIYFDLLDL